MRTIAFRGVMKDTAAKRRRIIADWGRIVFGLLVFAFGVHLTIFANIGLAPWDCLGMGIAKHTPLNYGLSMTLVALLVLLIDILLKERIGYGTIIDALLTGFVFMALGMWIYMLSGQCCGPRDALLVALGKRMPRIPIGIVEVILWAVVLLAGFLLGGPVGVGTIISTFGAGLVMQVVYSIINFEPRKIHHSDVFEVTSELLGGTRRQT